MYSLNTELTEAAKSGFIHEQKLEEIATNADATIEEVSRLIRIAADQEASPHQAQLKEVLEKFFAVIDQDFGQLNRNPNYYVVSRVWFLAGVINQLENCDILPTKEDLTAFLVGIVEHFKNENLVVTLFDHGRDNVGDPNKGKTVRFSSPDNFGDYQEVSLTGDPSEGAIIWWEPDELPEIESKISRMLLFWVLTQQLVSNHDAGYAETGTHPQR